MRFDTKIRCMHLLAAMLVFIWFAHARHLGAATDGEEFATGNQCYAAGNFMGATRAYEAQVKRGDYSANLFYNLGNAYYRLGSRGQAILNYRRALLLEPSHAEAAANLSFVRGDRPNPDVGGVNVITLCWMLAAAVWLTVVGSLTGWLLRGRRTLGLLLALTGLLGSVVGTGLLWRARGPTRLGPRAIVIDADVPAHYSPADNSKVVMRLLAGTEVQVLSDQGAWTYAWLGDGARAWIPSNEVERLIPHEQIVPQQGH